MRNDRYEEAAKAAATLLAGLGGPHEERKCPRCGAPFDGYGWRCDSCRAWIDAC
jgi:lipopolysaccharide biosynthesis regulator YciM